MDLPFQVELILTFAAMFFVLVCLFSKIKIFSDNNDGKSTLKIHWLENMFMSE